MFSSPDPLRGMVRDGCLGFGGHGEDDGVLVNLQSFKLGQELRRKE
jgi:hypothetical protein